MNPYIYKKLAITFLLVGGISFSGRSAGDNGIGNGRTFVIENTQFPSAIKKLNPAKVYLLYYGGSIPSKYQGVFFKGDTILNYKAFTDSLKNRITGFRLIYQSRNKIDSIWQLDTKFRITDKAYPAGSFLKIFAYDSAMQVVDNFIYNYLNKFNFAKPTLPEIVLAALLREYHVYDSYDRNQYAVANVWMLSIGIDDYGSTQWKNSKTDAGSYVRFFKEQFRKKNGDIADSLFYSYLLLDKDATKDSILKVLKEIAAKSSSNDYFIFNFSGQSNFMGKDSINYFFPFDVKGYIYNPKNRKTNDTADVLSNLISQNTLQEYLQLIPASNQLFICEAGPSARFKTEFIKTLMQNSFSLAAVLNKNRVIIVPNEFGLDEFSCNNNNPGKAPINYAITSLDPAYNIFGLFEDNSYAERIDYLMKSSLFQCRGQQVNESYFDTFFEKKFLRQYREIVGTGEGQTRGMKVKSKDVQETLNSLTGKHYALVVGTDNYKATGWNKLTNPVKDARAVADELSNSYGFEVQLLEDKPMDSIYKAIREYYRIAKPNDQLVVYFAGHGDVDDELLSDGFIVCTDSKSVDDDPVRNSYIPYTKLQKMLNNIPARQVLVLLDVCHGGTFDVKAFDKNKREGTQGAASNKNVAAFLKDKLPLRTRKFLSSVGSEPAFDGQAGRHSPFANLLLQVLRAKGNGSNGIVTLSDINAVLQTASLNETATLRISPHMADFGNIDAFSEFILIPVEKAATKE